MKSFLLLITLFSLSFFVSCSDDEEENNPSYEFLEQNLQGEIEGTAFNFGDGEVEFEADEMSFDLYSDQETEAACDLFIGEFSRIFFTMPNEEGLVELFIDFESFDGQTVTMFEPPGNNIIASEGAIEITAITETSVTGKMDIRFDDDNFVNGNFTAVVCP